MSDKLVKTNSAIVPAAPLANKVEEALANTSVDLLAVAKRLRKCTHPNHVDGKLCLDTVLGCHPDCPCCMNNNTLAMRGSFRDYADMIKTIDLQIADRLGDPAPRRAISAVGRAFELGVPARAETTVGPCGCVWALQTTFTAGSGDVILDICATHAAMRR